MYDVIFVNDLWSPYLMECGNLVAGSPHMYDVIFVNDYGLPHTLYGMQKPCNGAVPHMYDVILSMTYGPPYLIWNEGT